MPNIYDIAQSSKESFFAYSKEMQDKFNSEQRIEREKELLELQKNIAKQLQDLDIKQQGQREADRLERAKQRLSDRWFQAKMVIVAAILSGLLIKMLDIFFR